MGFITETLRLVIDADHAGAVRNVEKFGGTAEKEFSRAESSLDKWGNRLTTVGAGMIGFGTAALVGLGKAAQASEEAQLSVVKLENTLGNMPKLAGENSKQFVDLAGSIQDVTAADADAIVEGQALLGTFNLTAREIKGITPLVVDYARKFGIDIPDAAIQVGKALDGQVGALKRNGVSIDEVLFKTDRYKAVQEALSDQVGGFAEDEGKTFAGSLERLKNQMGDVVEGVGAGAVDAFTDLFGVVGTVTDKVKDMDPATQSLIGKVAAFGSVAVIAAGGTSIAVGQLMKMHENLSGVASSVAHLPGNLASATRAMGGLGKAAVFLGGPTALLAAGIALEQWNKAQQEANVERLTRDFLAAGKSAGEMADVIGSALDKGPAEFFGMFEELAQTNRSAATRMVDTLAEAEGESSEIVTKMREVLESLGEAEAQTAEDAEHLGDGLTDSAAAAEAAAEELQALNDELDTMFGRFLDVNASIGDQNQKLADMVSGLDEMIEKEGEAALTLDLSTEAGRSNTEALDGLFRATGDTISAMREQGATSEALRGQWQQDRNELSLVIDRFRAAGVDVSAYDALLGEIDALVDTQISVTGYQEAKNKFDSIFDAVRAIPNFKNIHMGVTGYTGGRAHGGPVEEGQPYWVGENRRPELFVPNSDGHIFTEQQLAAASTGGGGWGWGGSTAAPAPMVLEIRSGGSDLDGLLVEVLRKAIRVNGGNVQQYLGR